MVDPKVNLRRAPVIIQVRGWYPIVVICMVMILVTIGNIVYTNIVDDKRAAAERAARVESDRRWCALLDELNRGYEATPPQTEAGRRQAAIIAQLGASFGCGER